MLHIVNKSPGAAPSLASCLRVAQQGHAVILIEDGVYAATPAVAVHCGLQEAMKRVKVYVLQPDLEARGMAGRRIEGATPIDYAGFVDLVAQHPTNQTWL
jgi:tRNA 2-thiouridine synthesizing protein B